MFGQWITEFDWAELNAADDIDEMVEILHSGLLVQYNCCFPEISIKRRVRDKLWFNENIRSLFEQCELAHNSEDLDCYHQLRNIVQRSISQAKYFHRKVEHLKSSEPGKWHRQIRSLTVTGMNKKPSFSIGPADKSNRQLADDISLHFSSICNTLPPLDLATLSAHVHCLIASTKSAVLLNTSMPQRHLILMTFLLAYLTT